MMVKIAGHNFRRNTVEEVGKFAILWNKFEKDKCNNCCSTKKLRTMNGFSSSKYFQNLARVLKHRSELLGFHYDAYVRRGLSMGHGLNSDDMDLILAFMNSDGMDSLAGGLLAIYRIRNNMFHGLKEWTDLDNQIELFVAMNNVLEEMLLCPKLKN